MINELSIFVRTDLRTSSNKRVSNGKMAAQSAHALMSVVLSLFEKQENGLLMTDPNNITFFNKLKNDEIDIHFYPVKSKEEYLLLQTDPQKEFFIIEDQGRTSFKEPTLTTMASISKGLTHNRFIDCNSEFNQSYRSKQNIVINKDLIKDKWHMFDVVSKNSIQFLLDNAEQHTDGLFISFEKQGFKEWVFGAFAKIVLKPTNKTFAQALIECNNDDCFKEKTFKTIRHENGNEISFAIGADFIDIVDQYTYNGYSLV